MDWAAGRSSVVRNMDRSRTGERECLGLDVVDAGVVETLFCELVLVRFEFLRSFHVGIHSHFTVFIKGCLVVFGVDVSEWPLSIYLLLIGRDGVLFGLSCHLEIHWNQLTLALVF